MKKILFILIAMLLVAGCETPTTKQVITSLNKEQPEPITIEKPVVRKSAISGSWYPGDAETVKKVLDSYLANAKQTSVPGKIIAMIVPHAGWRYSGQTAAVNYKLLKNSGQKIKTVVVIGPSHTYPFYGASIPNVTHYETPLGLVPVSEKARELLKEPLFKTVPQAHLREHSIEIEIPFLQHTLGSFELVPILVGDATDKDIARMAESLSKIMDDETLIVVSSDFTHYGPNYRYIPFTSDVPDNIRKLDFGAVNAILNISPEKFSEHLRKTQDTICGRKPILLLLNYLQGKNVKAEFLEYQTSGNLTGDYRNSVSYVDIVFYEPKQEELTAQDKKELLKLARQTLETYLATGQKPKVNADIMSKALTKKQGCFVTLNKNGQLRGCIGHILPQEELYKCVIDNAVNAAVNDRRFKPVTYDELKDIEVEISVLTVPERVPFANGQDLKEKLEPMKDGVVLKRGWHQSTYLPQVWEQLPDKEMFLSRLCIKGGMQPTCWQDNTTQVYKYNAIVFDESMLEGEKE